MFLYKIKRYHFIECFKKNSFNRLTVHISLGSLECSNVVIVICLHRAF